jgi:hypothetical protein
MVTTTQLSLLLKKYTWSLALREEHDFGCRRMEGVLREKCGPRDEAVPQILLPRSNQGESDARACSLRSK